MIQTTQMDVSNNIMSILQSCQCIKTVQSYTCHVLCTHSLPWTALLIKITNNVAFLCVNQRKQRVQSTKNGWSLCTRLLLACGRDSVFPSEDRGTSHGRSLDWGGQCDDRDSWSDGKLHQCRGDDPGLPSHHSLCWTWSSYKAKFTQVTVTQATHLFMEIL